MKRQILIERESKWSSRTRGLERGKENEWRNDTESMIPIMDPLMRRYWGTTRMGMIRWFLHFEPFDLCTKTLIHWSFHLKLIPWSGMWFRSRFRANQGIYCSKSMVHSPLSGIFGFVDLKTSQTTLRNKNHRWYQALDGIIDTHFDINEMKSVLVPTTLGPHV